MRRISTATRVVNKFGAGKDGFTNGDPVGGIAATDMEDVWFDHMQEEIATFVEFAGLVLDPANRSQLLAAVQALFAAKAGNAAQTFSVAAASSAAHAVRYDQVIGLGQTQQNVTASRAIGTTYTNSTGKPIFVEVQLQLASGQGMNFQKNGANVQAFGNGGSGSGGFTTASIIPAGYTYGVTATPGATMIGWYELRP